MNLERLKLAWETPRWLSPVSAWIEHIPFALALLDLLRPGNVVELGTHMGDSYCAFCQAIDTLGLPARATAVDTWRGDPQAGVYGAEVLATLRRHHDPRYGRFSRLFQATFDEAAGEFAAGSIDLLHIDGLHTYEAVRHDFETWLPKMAPRGVILLHDTQEHQETFGVWRLWEELAGRYETFEFLHGHGLGIVMLGGEPGGPGIAPGMAEFGEWARRDAAAVRAFFAALGQRWQFTRVLQDLARHNEELCRVREEGMHSERNLYHRLQALAGVLEVQREAVALGRELIGPLEHMLPVTPFATPEGGDVKLVLEEWRRNLEAQNQAILGSLAALLPADTVTPERAAQRARLEQLITTHAPQARGRGKSVSIVIPTLNGGPLLGDVLAGLKNQIYDGAVEIVVVDSGSTDGTPALARAAGAQVLEVPRGEFNHGRTRNLAMERTRGDIIVLLTQDAVPANGRLLEQLVRGFDDPEMAGVFARQLPRPEHDVLVARKLSRWIAGGPQRRLVRIADPAAFAKLSPMERYLQCVFDNVCSAMRRRVWQTIPLRECDFGEDLDWSQRVLEAGWKILYEPEAMVVHSHSRGARYEYQRTYICHRMLYRRFGLQTMPRRRDVLRALRVGILSDLAYVWLRQKGLGRKVALSCQIPFWVHGAVMGQYQGARDERLGRAAPRWEV